LEFIDAILSWGELHDYYLAHSAKAELYRQLGKTNLARTSYERALSLTRQGPERRFLENRLKDLH
jgi:RNA polymerase sigma-70 factor (ECF subfamily)